MRKTLVAAVVPALFAGCAASPSVPIFGAFFPGWLLCLTGALFLTLILRAVLLKLGLAERLGPPVLVWPLLTIIFTLIFWIVFFQN